MMVKETRKLPPHTYMVETEKGVIFVHADSHRAADEKVISMGYRYASSWTTIEVIL